MFSLRPCAQSLGFRLSSTECTFGAVASDEPRQAGICIRVKSGFVPPDALDDGEAEGVLCCIRARADEAAVALELRAPIEAISQSGEQSSCPVYHTAELS